MTDQTMKWGGLRHPALHLSWAVPGAVLLSIPFVALAGLAQGAIGGCSQAPLGVDPNHLGLALGSCLGAAILMMIPLLIIPWIKRLPARLPLGIALGLSYGVIVALITHGQCPWNL